MMVFRKTRAFLEALAVTAVGTLVESANGNFLAGTAEYLCHSTGRTRTLRRYQPYGRTR